MTLFNERETGFEKEFAHERETEFKIISRRNWLLGLWAAERIGMKGEQANLYARNVVCSQIAEPEIPITSKLLMDFRSCGVEIPENGIIAEMNRLYDIVSKRIMSAESGT